MEIIITEEDKEKAGPYADHHNCVMATALKRYFPDKRISVGPDYARIGDELYVWSTEQDYEIDGIYYRKTKLPLTVEIKQHDQGIENVLY